MAAIGRTRKLDHDLTLHLYRAAGEKNHPDDLRQGLLDPALWLEPCAKILFLILSNSGGVWKFILDMARNHGEHAAMGTILLGLVSSSLKQARGGT